MVGVALAAVLLVGSTACGDDDAATGDAAQTEDVCDARAELTTSLEALQDVDVVEGGTSALEAAFADVERAVGDVADVAGDDLRDEVDAVEASFAELKGAVDSLGEAGTASAAIEAVSRSVADLAAAAGALGDELRDGCE